MGAGALMPAAASAPRSHVVAAKQTAAKVLAQKSDSKTDKSGDSATEETGPPWTYQMARITIALLVLLILGTGYLYRRLVVTRRRGEA